MSGKQRRGLGRGLGALIPTDPGPPSAPSSAPAAPVGSVDGVGGRVLAGGPAESATVGAAYFAELPIKAITPNTRQPRQVFEEEAMEELVHSIKEVGLLQP